MNNMIIFGADDLGKMCCAYFLNMTDCHIIAIWDNNSNLHGKIHIKYQEVEIAYPKQIEESYSMILISTMRDEHIVEIREQLKSLSVDEKKIKVLKDDLLLLKKIKSSFSQYDEEFDARIKFFLNFSKYVKEEHMLGNIAECGVCYGDFAFYMNRAFPERLCYLIDSFEGFRAIDVNIDASFGDKNFNDSVFNHVGLFKDAKEQWVVRKMLYPNNCVIKKGWVPEILKDVEDDFCFVNLDMDLYQPTLEAMKFFYHRMVQGGILLLHDYFHPQLPGIKRAVIKFEAEYGKVSKIPIGDGCSLAIIKNG